MRFVIHAGFNKCGSSAIQHALAAKQRDLIGRSVFLFGKDLSLNFSPPPADVPFWTAANAFIDPAARSAVPARLREQLARLSARAPNGTAVLSAEVLGAPDPALLFAGLDTLADTTIVFYVRPQFEWIPSAWKQWELKSGAALDAYVRDCLARNTPRFARTVEAWRSTLPRAKIVVRILAQAIAENGNPARDFFRLLGLTGGGWEGDDRRVNPSFDFALLNILNKNPWIFRSRQDNEPFKALMRILPERHLATNIKMLGLEEEQRIADHFAADNRKLLTTFCGLTEREVEKVYADYFRPRGDGRAYADVGEIEMINRGLGILLETLLERYGRKPILRPPYWKAPIRLARRLREKR